MTDDELYRRIKPLWIAAKPGQEAQMIRAALSMKHAALDDVPDYVWSLVDIAAQMGMNRVTGADAGTAVLAEPSADPG